MQTKPRDLLYCGARQTVIEQAEPLLNPVMLKLFCKYIQERYKVHLRRDVYHSPPPWTNDEILRRWRFTNVRREHDAQTTSLIIYVSCSPNLTLEEKVLHTFLFRTWNNKDTFRFFELPTTAERLYTGKAMKLARAKLKFYESTFPDKYTNRNWWNQAYSQTGMKTLLGNKDYTNTDKYDYATREPIVPLRPFHVPMWMHEWKTVDKLLQAKDQQSAFNIINAMPGYGSFIAYQIFIDLTYIQDFPFSENEFVVAGPGCKRGMNHVFIDRDGMTYEECLFWLRDNWNELMVEWAIPWSTYDLLEDLPKHEREMNIMSIENCFCEFQKYVRRLDQKPRKERYV